MKVRFLDSSLFLHAYMKPRRSLTPREVAVKRAAQEVLARVEEGEQVATTVVTRVRRRTSLRRGLGSPTASC